MTLSKLLFAGVAFCALCTAPTLVLAGPQLHLVAAEDHQMTLKPGSLHTKTNRAQPGITDVTYTLTLSGGFPPFKTPTLLWAYTWQNTKTCVPPHELLKLPKMDKVAKIRVGTTTGPTSACPASTFTFYGPMYDLRDKHPTSDRFRTSLIARHYSGYHYKAHVFTDLN